jgi:predicted nucleic acid-binding protein
MKRIVLDANILIRAVFGVRVLSLFETYEEIVMFASPDVCFEDARKYIPQLAQHRGLDSMAGLKVLEGVAQAVHVVDCSLYEAHRDAARNRIAMRDAEDWPIIATALLLDCPVWTEDHDFFGTGIATWTTRTIELYLKAS